MSIQQYFSKMQEFQNLFLAFIDSQNDTENKFSDLMKLIDQYNIRDNMPMLNSVLHWISNIANNYYHQSKFIHKIEQILLNLKNEIIKYFSNFSIFNIFKKNKRILLFLIQNKMLSINKQIASIMLGNQYYKRNYPQYFFPEIKSFLCSLLAEDIQKEMSDNFEEKRQNGENDSKICEIIREDKIDEFKSLINDFDQTIEKSIFETSPFLLKHQYITLIEYAAFFGSEKIFNFLIEKDIKITSSLLPYAFHSKNQKLIEFILQNMNDSKYVEICKLLKESIKCHYDAFISQNKDKSTDIIKYSLKYYNFSYIQIDNFDDYFIDICRYDYIYIVIVLLANSSIDDLNKTKKGFEETTALYSAVEKANIDIIKLLMTCDSIDVNVINKAPNRYSTNKINEETALYNAVEKENIEIIKLLMTCDNINVNIINKVFTSPIYSDKFAEKTVLYHAIEIKNIEIVKLLLTCKNIDVNIVNKILPSRDYVLNNIDQFSNNGKPKGDYIKFGKHYEYQEKTALYHAIDQDNIEIIKLLLISCDSIDVNYVNKLYSFNENGERNISGSVSIDYEETFIEKTALYHSIESEKIEIIKLLLSCENIDVNAVNKLSCYRPSYIVKNSEESGFVTSHSYNEKLSENTALCLAVKIYSIDIIKLLLTCDKNDVNFINKNLEICRDYSDAEGNGYFEDLYYPEDDLYRVEYYTTVLYDSTGMESIDIVRLLLTCENIDINIKNKCNENDKCSEEIALQVAVNADTDIAKLIMTRTNLDDILNINDPELDEFIKSANIKSSIQSTE